MASGLRTGRPGDRGSMPGRDKRIFPPVFAPTPALGPPPLPIPGVWGGGSFLGGKAQPGHDADYSSPYNVEIMNG
jgi:hypothetical protein